MAQAHTQASSLPMHGLPPGFQIEVAMGANLSAMRVRRGFTIRALAKATHLTVAQLEAYEDGKERVVVGDLLTIVDVLDMKISEVFAG